MISGGRRDEVPLTTLGRPLPNWSGRLASSSTIRWFANRVIVLHFCNSMRPGWRAAGVRIKIGGSAMEIRELGVI